MNIKTIYFISFLFVCMISFISCTKQETKWYDNAVAVAEAQLEKAANTYTPENNPRSINADGTIRLTDPRDWTCGFFPGSLWYMYELTGNKTLADEARRYTLALDSAQHFTYTHDLGFMLYCSYGNAFRITGDEAYKNVLLNGAHSLAYRFNPAVGCIRSWDFGEWQFPVIVDNMMNLEYMCWATKASGDTQFKDIATSHANVTMANHFRNDYSSYHVVSYDTISGETIQKGTHQGYSDQSSWARGQAWGLYGYAMMYRETKDKNYLDMAKNIATLIMNLENMPTDKIPYWDYDAPNIPDAPRDASAAAITASALLELSTFVPDGTAYYKYAEDILKNLSSPAYLAETGSNGYFILKHSVGALPNNSEVDTPINYADYYYLEALLRYKKLSVK